MAFSRFGSIARFSATQFFKYDNHTDSFFEASVRGQQRTKKLTQFVIIALLVLTIASSIGTYLSVQAERRISQANFVA